MLREKYGRYEVETEIGDGAMGRVYRGFDPLVRRTVAIKTVKSEYLTKDGAEAYLKRFRREAQAAGSLSHPNIVSIFDVGDDYFVMEFVEGPTLAGLIKEKGQLTLPEALAILGPVAEALDHAHENGIIHRDIKPANIMVQLDGRPKLMDFGVARLESSAMTATGQFLGSPSYMAPEQISGGDVSRKSDLFSLAVVAYEAVTGQKPFQGDSITSVIYRVMTETPPPPRQWNFDLPARYDEVFGRALSKEPADRFATAGEFLAALDIKEFEVAFSSVPVAAPGAAVSHGVASAAAVALGASPAPAPLAATRAPSPAAVVATLAIRGAPWLPGEAPPESVAASPDAKATRGPDDSNAALAVPPSSPARPAPGRKAWLLVAPLLVVAAAGLAVFGRAPQKPAVPAPLETLRIETEPSGAQVRLDGSEVGTSPLTLEGLAPGAHQVRVSLSGYASAELSVELSPGMNLAPLRFLLQSVMARLRVRSEPSGAALRVDGQPAGLTPLEKLELLAGRHEVKIEQKGFRPWVQQLEAVVGENPEIVARLEPIPRPGKPAPVMPSAPPPPAVVEGMLVELGPDVTAPSKVSGDFAKYPELARKLGLYGAVKVEFVVNERGEPTDLVVTESAGEILDKAVSDAIRTWRYEPARKDGIKVKVRGQARQTFQKRG